MSKYENNEMMHANSIFRETYKFEVLLDVLEMDACYVVLGHQWQSNVHVIYKGCDNTYTFT